MFVINAAASYKDSPLLSFFLSSYAHIYLLPMFNDINNLAYKVSLGI